MDRKLPKVFANKIDKQLNNNESVYYGNDVRGVKEETKKNTDKTPLSGNINQKINTIFNSPNYIYKADVEIKVNGKTVKKRIIGKNNTHLITFDNELILISDIEDINFAN